MAFRIYTLVNHHSVRNLNHFHHLVLRTLQLNILPAGKADIKRYFDIRLDTDTLQTLSVDTTRRKSALLDKPQDSAIDFRDGAISSWVYCRCRTPDREHGDNGVAIGRRVAPSVEPDVQNEPFRSLDLPKHDVKLSDDAVGAEGKPSH